MGLIRTTRGSKVTWRGEPMKVVNTPDFGSITLKSANGEYFHVTVADLEAEAAGQAPVTQEQDVRRQAKVPAYLDALGPLLKNSRNTKAEVATAAAKLRISVSSAYKAIQRFHLTGNTSDLPPPTRPGGRGKSRISPEAEEIIQNVIEDLMLNRRNFSADKFFEACKAKLEASGHKVSHWTLNQRLANISPYKWKRAREGYSAARRTMDPLKGQYPEVGSPLDVIQVDHWRADIEVLSDDREKAVGRVWITLAIDIFSRMIFGLQVGFDAPSFTTLGLAMMNGVLRKDIIAERYGLEWDNPIYGMFRRLEADNAGEFRGHSLQMTATHFNFEVKFRPLGAPQYGGHIERLNGNLAREFKSLPGATGADNKQRKLLRPEMTAAFNLEDLTKQVWLIVNKYHNQVHSSIGMTPLEKYKSYFFNESGQRAKLPDVYVDNLDFRMHWYPLDRRSFQRYGIVFDYLHYYCDEMEYLIRNGKKYGRVPIRLNPFDIREIYVYHPERKEWMTAAIRHIGFPIASIYELQEAKRTAKARKRAPTPEVLRKIIEEQQAHIESAEAKTKLAKRAAARRSHHNRIRKQILDERPVTKAPDQADVELVSPAAVAPVGTHGVTEGSRQQYGTPADDDIGAILAGISDDDIESSFS